MYSQEIKNIEEATKMLQRLKPAKVINKYQWIGDINDECPVISWKGTCPHCGWRDLKYGDNYCPECGQALEWEDKKESVPCRVAHMIESSTNPKTELKLICEEYKRSFKENDVVFVDFEKELLSISSYNTGKVEFIKFEAIELLSICYDGGNMIEVVKNGEIIVDID